MQRIVFRLHAPVILCYADERLDALRHLIAEEHHLALRVPRGATGGLHEAGLAAQVAFFVRIENAHERDFRQVEALTEEIDADENIKLTGAQSAENFHALDGVHVGVNIAHAQIQTAQVIGEVFGGALGEGGHEHTLLSLHALAAEFDGFVYLALQWLER